ncbi:hypothetical protein BDP27DRAFT_231843 [Rhodocollybia butyracea]|uniref:Uncharacterized protein n=1 Tax=Rhodocollybia butyracea TaxID=206335 RepID=A0A9P5PE79_9AGAR|nr:hypothetical protein BDP27DRAFT_231843 [Rhodocollybia butyracea]
MHRGCGVVRGLEPSPAECEYHLDSPTWAWFTSLTLTVATQILMVFVHSTIAPIVASESTISCEETGRGPLHLVPRVYRGRSSDVSEGSGGRIDVVNTKLARFAKRNLNNNFTSMIYGFVFHQQFT